MSDSDNSLILAGLNRSQRKFCKMPPKKNIRLLAPAGSGKTFSILWRCKYIADEYERRGQPAPRFLIVTFTRSARFELEHRIETEPRFQNVKATVRTLNAWGWEQIHKPGKELITQKYALKQLINHDLLPLCKRYPGIYKCISTARGQAVNAPVLMDMIDILKSLGFTHLMSQSDYNRRVKELKDLGLYPMLDNMYLNLLRMEGMLSDSKEEQKKAITDFFKFWKRAVIALEANNRYTLEDQKYWAKIYLESQIEQKKFPQGITKYTHIVIDEFQDINPMDMALIKTISKYNGQGKDINITIVGDDDQAIFGWRGTTPKYILDPERYFEVPFETCVLDTNYRSPQPIVSMASRFISHNKDRVEKEMKSAAKGHAYISVLSRKKDYAATEATIRLVHELIDKKGCKQVALIGRKQSSLFPYQVLFSAEKTQYNVAADIDIFDGEAMRSLQSILKTVYRAKNNDNDDPVEELIGICDKIDFFAMSKLERRALAAYLRNANADTFFDALDALGNYREPIKKIPAEELRNKIYELTTANKVYDFMSIIEEDFKGFYKNYNKKEIDNHYKNPQIQKLIEISKRYDGDFQSFYRDIEKARKNSEYCRTRASSLIAEDHIATKDVPIHLVTATRSKGHEYDAVIILDAYDDEWPNRLTDDIEEERRLFYVAMTRAKKYLYYQESEEKLCSRFLLEADVV